MRVAGLVLSVLLAASAAPAPAQEPPAQISSAELHRVRAEVAWRRAVWRISAEEFERAVKELEAARAAPGAVPDYWVDYMLAFSYARLKRVPECDAVLKSMRDKLGANASSLMLVDSVRRISTPEGDQSADEATAAVATLGAFLEEMNNAPPGSPFAPELRFLSHFYRGRLEWRLARQDSAVTELTRAMELSRAAGHEPAMEVVSLLAWVHLDLDQAGEAKRLVMEAMARDPAEAAHYYNMGQILIKEHDDLGARRWFEAALARRPSLVEAHLKLALVGRHTADPAAMLPHLEAVKAFYDGRAQAKAPVDAAAEADVQCGYGLYWKLVGDRRTDEGDDAGAREAYEQATRHLREALAKQKGCVQALSALIQIASKLGRDEEIPELRKSLDEVNKQQGRRLDPFRSTFC
jgi:tetratricopeptide (TPR) repeat protein